MNKPGSAVAPRLILPTLIHHELNAHGHNRGIKRTISVIPEVSYIYTLKTQPQQPELCENVSVAYSEAKLVRTVLRKIKV